MNIYHSILLSRKLWPPDSNGQPPTIQFEQLLTAVRLSYRYSAIGDMDLSTWNQADMEALCASLVDQVRVSSTCICTAHDDVCMVGLYSGLPASFSLLPSRPERIYPWFSTRILSNCTK